MRYKVAVFGKNGSGKTLLNHKIAQKKVDSKSGSCSTLSVEFLSRQMDSENTVNLWDISGDQFEQLHQIYYKGTDVGVFCIDLTEQIDEQDVIKRIQVFRNFSPKAPIICVGTKSDSPQANLDAFQKIKSQNLFTDFILTSAKSGDNVDELFSLICKHCEAKLIISWNEAVARLKKGIMKLPEAKRILIEKELSELSTFMLAKPGVSNVQPKDKADAIEKFTKNCEIYLEGGYSNIYKAALSVAAVAIVLTITALIGFSIGFACSWWTGPGAFFTGILSGYTSALTVASSSVVTGLVAGGVTAYGLFKLSEETRALNEFDAEVSSWNTAIIL